MQTTLVNTWMKPMRFFAAGTCAVLLAAFTLLFGSASARAVNSSPIVVTGPVTQIGTMHFTSGSTTTTGGWDAGASPVGGTFVFGANGDVIIGDGYGSIDVFEITQSGTQTILASGGGGNSSAAAIDAYGNVYIAFEYNGNVYKIPYNASTGTYAGYTTAPSTNCSGGTADTAACVFAPNLQALKGIAGLAFDQSGNFIIATDAQGSTKNSIYVCNAACQTDTTNTHAPALVYTDTNNIGAIAADPWGNLFFSDGASSSAGAVSNLQRIPLSGGTYGSPTVVISYTSKVGYTNGIAGVAIGADGTVYFGTNTDGIFGIPNSSSGPSLGGTFAISTAAGGKAIAADSHGNIAFIPYSNSLSQDVISILRASSFQLAATTIGGTATTATATITESVGTCTPTLTLTTTSFGVSTTEFSAAAGSSCSAALGSSNGTFSQAIISSGGAVTTATISFSAAAVGDRRALLSVNDSTNGAHGKAALGGVGQGAMVNVDPGLRGSFSNGLSGPQSAVADAAGNVFVADPSLGEVLEFPVGSSAPGTPIGSGFTHPVALAFDADDNLYIADNAGPNIYQIQNTGTSGSFVAGGQQTVISSTFTFSGKTLSFPTGLAVSADGILYISDSGNSRVVSFDLHTNQGGVTLAQGTIQGLTSPTGLQNPQGLTLDSSGNLYVADSVQNLIFIVWSNGVVSTIAPPSVTSVTGVAVDAAGNLIVADSASDGPNGSNIVLIPNQSGTLTTANAVVIEAVAPTASSLSMNGLGWLYIASSSGKEAIVIMRSQGSGAAVNIGSVADGASNSANVILQVTGNMPAALPVSDLTQPATPWITLAPAATKGCNPGTGNPGQWCYFTATFAPPAGTAAGPYSDTADILTNPPVATIPVLISGNATASAALPNSITWTPSTTGIVGQVVSLSATSTSTEPVAFASTTSGTCLVSGNTTSGFMASFTGAGTCTIQATVPACSPNGCSVSGNLYAAAAPVSKSITLTTLTSGAEPALLLTQSTNFPNLKGGGVLAGPIAAGTSIGVGNNGYVAVSETYGGNIDLYNLATGTVVQYGQFDNPGGVAADSQGNLYISGQYNNQIAKIPYVNGSYAALGKISGSTPTCTSTSTTECVLGPIKNVSSIGGIGAMTFDSNGNLFLAQNPQGSTPFSIWECTAACLSTGTPAPVELFQEPTGTTNLQLYVGALAVDPWGNLFFTDTMFYQQAANSNNDAYYSDLYELPTSTGTGFGGVTTGYAATPTQLQEFCDGTLTGTSCDGASSSGYDNNMDAVAVAPNGTVYYANLYNGVYAIPNTHAGGPVVANQYPVFGSGAKVLGIDAQGNLYEVSGALTKIAIDNLTEPTAQYQGSAVNGSATIVANGIGYCPGTAPNLAFAFSGTNAGDFSASAGSTCSGLGTGGGFLSNAYNSTYPVTLTFTPNHPGAQNVTVTASSTNYGGVGTAAVSALAQTTPETISFTGPSTTTYTYAAAPNQVTIPLTVANGPSNFPAAFTIDASSTGAGTLSSTTVTGTNSTATLTVTQAGTIVIDAVEPAGLATNNIYYSQSNTAQLTLTINQASQTITFTPIAQSTYTYAAAPNQVTIPLSATGGASGNPVEFSVDASSTGTATITPSNMVGSASLATLTVTGAGTIVIDASQAASTDYAAASLTNAQTLTVNQAAQTITFVSPTQPIHFIAGGITVPITAKGGGSNNPITFTIDPSSTMTATIGASTVSGANSTATLTIPAQANSSGTIVLNATQPQSANYAAASATPLVTLAILAPLPTQTITFPNPGTQVVGTPVTLTATASSTLPVTYTSSTPSACTLVGAVVSFNANISTATTCTIVATQPGDNTNWAAAAPVTVSFTVNPTGQNPSINIALSLSALTIQQGTSGLTQLTVTSMNNFAGWMNVTCSGLPSGYTCTANPNPVQIAAGGTATTTITVTPPASSAMLHHDSPLAPLAAVAFALGFLGFRKRTRLQLLVVLVLGLTALGTLSACGGSSTTTKGTGQPTLSTATIKVAASGMGGSSSSTSVQQSTTLKVTVQ